MSLGSKPKSKWAFVIQPLCLKANKVKRANSCVLGIIKGFSTENHFWNGFLQKLINKHIGKNKGWIRQSKRDQDWRVDYNCAVVMYFENVSINRTARCSSSLHYPAAGRMPKTRISQNWWRRLQSRNSWEGTPSKSETEDNPARDPSLHRFAWPYGFCVGVWYASNRDDRKTCSSLQRVWWYGLTSDVQ